ncbi:Signal peptide peptidase family protein [Brugia pahangi]
MDYILLTVWNMVILIASVIIYTGCRRSYSIYFFERDAKRIIFLEDAGAVAVPVVLSVLLIILHYSLKLSGKNDMEERTEQKLPQSQTSNVSRQLTRKMPIKLDSISESVVAGITVTFFIDGNEKEMKTKLSEDLPKKMESVDGSNSEEYLISDEILSTPSLKNISKQLIQESKEVSENIAETEPTGRIDQENPSNRTTSLQRKSSILSDHELDVERKRSQIYKKMGKVTSLPAMNEMVTVMHFSSINISKRSVLNILGQLISIHIPIWFGVIAVQITVVEIFDNKFYQLFYYHHPRMKQLAMVIAVLLGLFHEVKWTWIVNDMLGIATSYVIIARIETASYFAGFLFLLGMILFDIFWFYCFDLFSVVTKHSRSPLMLIIPLGKNQRPASISVLDIIVPGIFLNILLKFAEMYDSEVFVLSFYACIFGLLITELITLLQRKSTPAIVLPGIFALSASMLSVENPSDLWRFGIKH